MSRFSDVWIVLSLAAVAGWKNWDRLQPELASAAAIAVAELTPPATQAVTPVAQETASDVVEPAQAGREPFGRPWTTCPTPFDCTHAPSGCVIIHDFHSPACGPPVICRGY